MTQDDDIVSVQLVSDNTDVIIYSDTRALRISSTDINLLKRNTIGTLGMGGQHGDLEGMSVIHLDPSNPTEYIVVITEGGKFNKFVANKLGFKHETQRLISLLDIDKNKFNNFVKLIRTSKNSKLSFFFYAFRCMLDNDISEDTIIERTMMSTYYFEKDKVSWEEWDIIMKNHIVPDITFLLYASSNTRYQRIYERDKNDTDLTNKEALNDGYSDMIEFAKRYNIPYIGINTEKYSRDQIIEICSDAILYYSSLESKEDKKEFVRKMNENYGVDDLYLLGGDDVYERKIRFNNSWNGA